MPDTSPSPPIALIIPCWKDYALAERHLALRRECPDLVAQIIISAIAGYAPEVWQAKMRAAGAEIILNEKPSRGAQMAAGAELARAPLLVFNHVDTWLRPEHLRNLADRFQQVGEPFGGAFYRKFDGRHKHPFLQAFENFERWHNRNFGTLYGDQTLFASRKLYHDLGGMPEIPLMEDLKFSLKMRRHTRIHMIDPPLETSPRMFTARGSWQTTARNIFCHILFRLGISPQKLHAFYYRKAAIAGEEEAMPSSPKTEKNPGR